MIHGTNVTCGLVFAPRSLEIIVKKADNSQFSKL